MGSPSSPTDALGSSNGDVPCSAEESPVEAPPDSTVGVPGSGGSKSHEWLGIETPQAGQGAKLPPLGNHKGQAELPENSPSVRAATPTTSAFWSLPPGAAATSAASDHSAASLPSKVAAAAAVATAAAGLSTGMPASASTTASTTATMTATDQNRAGKRRVLELGEEDASTPPFFQPQTRGISREHPFWEPSLVPRAFGTNGNAAIGAAAAAGVSRSLESNLGETLFDEALPQEQPHQRHCDPDAPAHHHQQQRQQQQLLQQQQHIAHHQYNFSPQLPDPEPLLSRQHFSTSSTHYNNSNNNNNGYAESTFIGSCQQSSAASGGALQCLSDVVQATDAESEMIVTDGDLTMVHIQSWEQKLDWRSFLSEAVAARKAREIFKNFDIEAEPPRFLRPPSSRSVRPSQGLELCGRRRSGL